MTLEVILAILSALVGWPALVALLIDILKFIGVVQDGTAGRWNLGFQILGFVLVGVLAGFYPQIDIAGLDESLLAIVNILAYLFALVVELVATRTAHVLYTKTEVGKKYFTYNSYQSEIA